MQPVTPQVIRVAQHIGQTADNYEVGHNAGVWVITPDDRVHLLYGFGTREQDWATDLPEIATEPEWAAAGSAS